MSAFVWTLFVAMAIVLGWVAIRRALDSPLWTWILAIGVLAAAVVAFVPIEIAVFVAAILALGLVVTALLLAIRRSARAANFLAVLIVGIGTLLVIFIAEKDWLRVAICTWMLSSTPMWLATKREHPADPAGSRDALEAN
jgi:hypothetical protein